MSMSGVVAASCLQDAKHSGVTRDPVQTLQDPQPVFFNSFWKNLHYHYR